MFVIYFNPPSGGGGGGAVGGSQGGTYLGGNVNMGNGNKGGYVVPTSVISSGPASSINGRPF